MLDILPLACVAHLCLSALPCISRIITLTSTLGLCPTSAFLCPFAASCHATRAFTASLRHELAPLGIHVSRYDHPPTFIMYCIMPPSYHSSYKETAIKHRPIATSESLVLVCMHDIM